MDIFSQWYKQTNKGFIYRQPSGVGAFFIPSFEETGLVKHGFTTRIGGISTGSFAELNLSWTRTESIEETRENYKIACKSLGIDDNSLVVVNCQHTDNVVYIDEKQAGDGYKRLYDEDEAGFDAMLTDKNAVTLCTIHGDCVPIFLLDTKNKVIGLCHAGWKGTVKRIVAKLIDKMKDEFNSQSEDILSAVGPCIGKCCFEVHSDVAELFMKEFAETGGVNKAANEGKYMVDLQAAVAYDIYSRGIPSKNVTIADICTCCNEELFHSYRRDGLKAGSMAAFLKLL